MNLNLYQIWESDEPDYKEFEKKVLEATRIPTVFVVQFKKFTGYDDWMVCGVFTDCQKTNEFIAECKEKHPTWHFIYEPHAVDFMEGVPV